jgi:mRNA interferase MazF
MTAIDTNRSKSSIAMFSGNVSLARSEPAQLLIDPATVDGRSWGLNFVSSVKCNNLYTVDQEHVLATIGHHSTSLMSRVDACLKAALGLP